MKTADLYHGVGNVEREKYCYGTNRRGNGHKPAATGILGGEAAASLRSKGGTYYQLSEGEGGGEPPMLYSMRRVQ